MRSTIALVVIATLSLVARNAGADARTDPGAPLLPVWQETMPYAKAQIEDCDDLLAARLSRTPGNGAVPLADCSVTTFAVSPALTSLDCTGLTANACSALHRESLPHHYMNGGWSSDHELWYLPLPDDVSGGNLCVDGSRQFVYADKAVAWQCSTNASQCTSDSDCGAGVCERHDVESNDWVFYTQGGDNCVTGQECLDKYLQGSATMSSLNAPFSHDGGGLLSDDPRNPFHGYNRVRLKKCTKDAFMGNATRPHEADEARPEGIAEGVSYYFDLYFHGVRQWLATFETLTNGYANHREYRGSCLQHSDCDNGGVCVNQAAGEPVNMCRYTVSLPALSGAQSIVLAGWSGGSVALAHTGDRLVEHLQRGSQPLAPNAAVSLVYDAPWKPALESDTAFASGGRNMYLVSDDQIPTADAPMYLPDDADAAIESGADAAFSDASLSPGGLTYEAYQYWGAAYDESCALIHGLQSWHCYERNHVLANHVTAPSFTRIAQRDSSGKDTPGSKHLHSMDSCRQEQTEINCYDWHDEDFRQRGFQQSVDFYRHFELLGEEGAGTQNRGAFATDNTKHNGLEDPEQFFDVELMQCRADGAQLRTTTLSGALHDWQQTGQRVGAIEWREGSAFGNGYLWVDTAACSRCPLVDAGQNFVRDDALAEWDLSMCTGLPVTLTLPRQTAP